MVKLLAGALLSEKESSDTFTLTLSDVIKTHNIIWCPYRPNPYIHGAHFKHKKNEKGFFKENGRILLIFSQVIPKVFRLENNCLKLRAPQRRCALLSSPLSSLQKHFTSSNTEAVIPLYGIDIGFLVDCTWCTFCITHWHFLQT